MAPASRKVFTRPSFSAWRYTAGVAGITMHRTPLATLRPLRICAASLRSSILPLVQEPMITWSILTSPASLIPREFSGRCGNATWGSMFEQSNSVTEK